MRVGTGILLAVVATAGAVGCRGGVDPDGKAAVMRYLDKLIQAYRASDEEIVDPLVVGEHGDRLVGLIGVKRDQGVVLDAELLEIEFDRSRKQGSELLMETRERWRYRHRQIGTGAVSGPESTDSYRVRYRLVRDQGVLKISQVEFLEEPKVGTRIDGGQVDLRAAHGLKPDVEPPADAQHAGHPQPGAKPEPPPPQPPQAKPESAPPPPPKASGW